jgi:2'-5' RNA ligase
MHRLFLGLPIEPELAGGISAWATEELTGVRIVPPENLHVTLLFFGSVDEATRDRLIDLTLEAVWKPIAARTGELAALGKSALALRLEVPHESIRHLEDRLARSCHWSTNEPYQDEEGLLNRPALPKSDPLYQMALSIPEPERVQKVRRQRQRQPLEMHLTVARTKSRPSFELSEKRLPPIDLILDRLVLFESHLGPEGSRCEVLAEAKS